MFRSFYLAIIRLNLCPVRGNYAICDIKSLVSNEISFFHRFFCSFEYFNDENEISLDTTDLISHHLISAPTDAHT